MNRAMEKKSQLKLSLTKFSEVSHGRFQSHIISWADIIRFILLGMPLGVDDTLIFPPIECWLADLSTSNPMCLDCESKFSTSNTPDAFLVVLPCANDSLAMVLGICARCMEKNLEEMVSRWLKQIWPDIHRITEGNA